MNRKQVALVATMLIDVVLINLAFILAYMLRYDLQLFYPLDIRYDAPFRPYIPFALLLTGVSLIAFQVGGLYAEKRGRSWWDEISILVTGTAISMVILMAVTFFIHPLVYSRAMLVYAALLVVLLLAAARLIRRPIETYLRMRGIGVDRVLIVGAGDVGRAVMRNLLANPILGYHVVGYIDDDPVKGNGELGRFKGLGGMDNLSDILVKEEVAEVIVTLPWHYHRKIMQVVEKCERQHIRVRIVPDIFQQRLRQLDMDSLGGIPVIGLQQSQISQVALIVKRAIDIVGAILLLILSAPLMAVVILAIRIDSPGPAVFRHQRVGRNGQEFQVYKFRSMIMGAEELQKDLRPLNEADGPLFKIRDDPRLTRMGRFLRRTSIDELPQFLNVLRGEMSLVGPRPGTPEEIAQYDPWQRERLAIWPGMTGLWQVSGRSNVPFDEMCQLDIYYIENWSLGLDLRILLRTIPHVIFGRGAY
jgi:exopolysaccharide biosynthesis polyprenyl glycosylphosphotransferase